ncbi:MAG: zinc ribbon domain-containing protein [Peptococcaceae bacterium]|jgi:uncharacterized OB-fold protein|nr:zinc ribbon domain-containing protein [Peptococcaceae bacterium]MDH7524155.1 zinc ribbon domain-containing protein [Peptococcaceae bacterium]
MGKQVLFWPELFKETDKGLVLVANKCKKCGAVSFPKNELCVFCLGEEMEEVELSRKGILYSYTITRVPVDKWTAPHAIGQISIPENQLRIVAPLIMEDENDTFNIGDELEMEIAKYWDDGDNEVMGYKYRPVKKKGGK